MFSQDMGSMTCKDIIVKLSTHDSQFLNQFKVAILRDTGCRSLGAGHGGPSGWQCSGKIRCILL